MLWLLRAKEDVGYDSYSAFVIEANTEEDARQIAQTQNGDETIKWISYIPLDYKNIPFWTSEQYSTCILLESRAFKPGEIVISSYHAG